MAEFIFVVWVLKWPIMFIGVVLLALWLYDHKYI